MHLCQTYSQPLRQRAFFCCPHVPLQVYDCANSLLTSYLACTDQTATAFGRRVVFLCTTNCSCLSCTNGTCSSQKLCWTEWSLSSAPPVHQQARLAKATMGTADQLIHTLVVNAIPSQAHRIIPLEACTAKKELLAQRNTAR